MTPNDIDVLMHYYACFDKHPRIHAPAVRESINMFLKEGILVECGETYRTTKRGDYFVGMICATPFPVQVFVDPRLTD